MCIPGGENHSEGIQKSQKFGTPYGVYISYGTARGVGYEIPLAQLYNGIASFAQSGKLASCYSHGVLPEQADYGSTQKS